MCMYMDKLTFCIEIFPQNEIMNKMYKALNITVLDFSNQSNFILLAKNILYFSK